MTVSRNRTPGDQDRAPAAPVEPGGPWEARSERPAREMQAHLALQYSLASILAAASDVGDVMPLVLQAVCEHLGWDAGAYWGVEADGERLRCRTFWQRETLDLGPFRAISGTITFAAGEGLPGRVWASGTPALIRDVRLDANFPRAPMAATVGLRGAVCFPATTAAGIHGVVECFSRAEGDLDENLLRALTALGAQIGQFVERMRAEAARRATEVHRISMLETALDAVVSMDQQGRVVEFNPAAERIFGYTRAAALGRELADLIIPPEQRDRHRAGLERYLATGEGPLLDRRLEVVALRADGARFPAEVSITRVPLDGPPLFVGYIRDLSERRRMEAALRMSEERLRTVVAHAPLVLFAVDRDGIFTLSEGAGLAALGIRPGEHVGQSYFALYADLPESVATMRRALAGEQIVSLERFRGLVFETRWVPVRDADGGVAGVIGVSAEITERARLDEERRQFEERTRGALDALLAMADVVVRAPGAGDSPAPAEAAALRLCALTRDLLGCRGVGAIAVRADDTLRPLAFVGLSPEQTEQWFRRIAAWPSATPLYRALAARLHAGETVRIDTGSPEMREMANPFGIERYLLAPMRVGTALVGLLALDYGPALERKADDAALVEGVAGLAALVLERERLQRDREEARGSALVLQEANRRMDEFLGIAGHEMRTPLTSVQGNVQLARRRLRAALSASRPDQQGDGARIVDAARLRATEELLARAERQVGVLDRLVADLLDVSRVRSGRLELRPAPCDLATIMREAVEEQRLIQPDRAIHLELPGAVACNLVGDAERLGQVVTNYLTNALKYSAADQPVVARLECGEREALVTVRDRGPGIPEGERERIWERFHRVPGIEVRSGSGVGLGMGLHICRTIVEQHGGRVGVESVVGEGSTFWFSLPRAL